MKVRYYWDYSTFEFKMRTSKVELINYFNKNKKYAVELIDSVNRDELRVIIPQLNLINEKMKLLFFYTQQNEFLFEEVEIIPAIEHDYIRTFYEEVEISPVREILESSLLYAIDKPVECFIWERNIIQILTKVLGLSDSEVLHHYQDWIIYFYEQRQLARKIIRNLSDKTFKLLFPKLLVIDCKCKELIEDANLQKEFHLTSNEYLRIVNSDIDRTYFNNFLFQYETSEINSLRLQIDPNVNCKEIFF